MSGPMGPRKTGRFYPNLTGKIDADAEQSIYRLFDDVYQLRTSVENLQAVSPVRPLTLDDIQREIQSTGTHPINIVNLPGMEEAGTPHFWEETEASGIQWLSPSNVNAPSAEARVIVGADVPVGVNGALIPDVTATTGFRSQVGMAFNLGVFNTLGNFARAIDTKWSNMFIGAFSSGIGGPGIITRPLSIWNADHVGTSAVGFVQFSSVTNPGNISINVNNACNGASCGSAYTVTNSGGVRWSMGMNGGASHGASTFCISSAPATNNPCSNARISIDGTSGDVTLFNNLSVGGTILSASSVDNVLFEFGGNLISGGASNFAAGMFNNVSVTAFAGDISFLTGLGVSPSAINTAGAAEVYASVSSLRLVEPNITVNAGDSITIAATLHVLSAPTEGVNNYAIKVDAGLTSAFDFEHTGTLLGFYGTAPIAQPSAYTVTNHTADKTYDANATSVAELADVLGSLLLDLINLGVLQGSVT